jgi:hypothetical protein
MSKDCPKQKYALGGHSQGGNVTYHAIPRIPKDILPRIVAVTMFGSPACREQVADRCNSYCYKGDFACDGPKGGAFGEGGVNGLKLPSGKGPGGKRLERKGPGLMGMPEMSINTVGIQEGRLDDACPLIMDVRGHVPKVSGMPHEAYSADGYYIYAAACYVVNQFKKLSST